MNHKPNKPHPEVIGQNVAELQEQLDTYITDPPFRDRLKQSLKQLADVKFALDESSIVAVTDHRGTIQYVNDNFCEISKFDRDELIGQDHRIINSSFHSKEFMTDLWRTISSGQVWRGDIKNKTKDGMYYWVNTTIVPFQDDNGRPYQYLAIRNEVTQLKKVEEELKLMMGHVMQVQEDERRKFSRELHDGIGQSLFSLLIQIDRLIGDTGMQQLSGLRSSVAGIIEDVRGLAWELRPSVLDDLGVVPAIRSYIESYSNHYGIKVYFDCNLRKRLEANKETTIYRIIQEALTNLAKYAEVSEARVKFHEFDDYIEVRVEDQGIGFTRETDAKGVGLFSMEERARSVHGQITILSKPGEGTKVTLIVPK
ncbi:MULTISPECIES: PAS domain-containing sensor histidine kinase [unclassified Paenibacillus]|uniref:PAS domain-containing sensor histidine kinase n=1 Tax=unclassified Paenibacillus TaxID=185978 RepID=UPI001B68C513|nr:MULTISPECIES: PAS domain-containing sensor histidine kinase [unclassified Paenibacillus]MBP1153714.1 PAS domain S-box-containing protein [Paenibacillus sp. PvP091]MBP1170901.1 PAS domain S-box-containing protein [Paenibacillus sp. PvR098]MBP2441929.1 PAS domain S-box-containing protein [Paenibacillus sp. PvP052]